MKWIVGITAIVVILGMYYGVRLAWLRTPAMLYTQVLLFPILVGACIYVLFIAKRGTRTGYQIAMSRIREKTGRIHYAVWGVLGAILLPAGCAHFAYVVPAWAANAVATEPFAGAFRIDDIRKRSGPRRTSFYEIYLLDHAGDALVLPYSAAAVEAREWRAGDTVCLHGRTSIFGTIVRAIRLGDCGVK